MPSPQKTPVTRPNINIAQYFQIQSMMIFKAEGKGPIFLPYSFTGICNGTQLTNPNNKSQLSRAIN